MRFEARHTTIGKNKVSIRDRCDGKRRLEVVTASEKFNRNPESCLELSARWKNGCNSGGGYVSDAKRIHLPRYAINSILRRIIDNRSGFSSSRNLENPK